MSKPDVAKTSSGITLNFYPKLPHLRNVSSVASIICQWLFVVGMALLGSWKLAGAFYILSLVLGLYLLWRLPRVKISIPAPLKLYLGFYLAFVVLVVVHVLVLSGSGSNIDQVSRIGLGLLNGFTFLALCGFSRQKLFDVIVLMAGAHACVAICVALYQGIDFATLSLAPARAHGVTNAIPFSEMLFTSFGLLVIAISGRIDLTWSYIRIFTLLILLVLLFGLGIFAVYLTGTRGTLSAFVLLFPLVMFALFDRLPLWFAVVFGLAVLTMALIAANFIFARDPQTLMFLDFLQGAPATTYPDSSIGIRLQMWTHAIDLISSAPLLGHGIDSFPQILARPELGVAENSILMNFSNVHNIYLDVAMKMGIVGALLFFAPLVVALVTGLRMALNPDSRVMGLAILWAGGSYAIYGLTQSFYGHASTTLQYGVYLGMLLWLAPGGRYGDIIQRPETVA